MKPLAHIHLYNVSGLKTIAILSLCLTGTAVFAQSSSNSENGNDYKKADALLNSTYNQILNEYKDDVVFTKKLRDSQNIWIQFRDAELEMKYPDQNKQAQYGTVYPECANAYLTDLTMDRISKLNVWLDGIEEGDVCSGSVKRKEN